MKVPKHLGIILDGNRRFAKRLNLDPKKGHEYGAKKISELLKWCKGYNIKKLTLFVFSLENFNRPKDEFNYLMNLFRKEFENIIDNENVHKNKIRVRIIGRTSLFPKDIQDGSA